RLTAAWSPAYAASAPYLRVLGLALVPMFMNAVLLHALIAAGRPQPVPALTALRVAAATVLALALIPRAGALGAACGFLASELVLLSAASRACAKAGFAVPVASPLAWGAALALPCVAAAAWGGAGLLGPGAAALAVCLVLATAAVAYARAPRKEARS